MRGEPTVLQATPECRLVDPQRHRGVTDGALRSSEALDARLQEFALPEGESLLIRDVVVRDQVLARVREHLGQELLEVRNIYPRTRCGIGHELGTGAFELAHVARPGVVQQYVRGPGLEAADLLLGLLLRA